MNEEDNSIFHLPSEASVSDVSKVSVSEQSVQLTHSFSSQNNLSDQALFDELNAVSEEVIKCRNQVLSKIS